MENKRLMQDSDIDAYHESGHAFMAIYVGAKIRSITIEPDRDDGPDRFADVQVEWPRYKMSDRDFYEKSILVALSGPVAEMIYTGDPFHPATVAEWSSDWAAAWNAAANLIDDKSRRLAFLEQITRQIYQLLHDDQHWQTVAAIVDELSAHETLDGGDVAEVYRTWVQ